MKQCEKKRYGGKLNWILEKNVEVFNFGKYKGQPVKEVFRRDPGYYSWIMQGDFPLNTKQVVNRIKMS